jgi:hypothetical protein
MTNVGGLYGDIGPEVVPGRTAARRSQRAPSNVPTEPTAGDLDRTSRRTPLVLAGLVGEQPAS